MPENRRSKGLGQICPTVYVLVSGKGLEDRERRTLKEDVIALMRARDVGEMRDGDVGLLPMNSWYPPNYEMMWDQPSCTNDSINTFIIGKMIDGGRFGIKEVESSMKELIKKYDERMYFVVFVIESPLHRSYHRDHICIPSLFILQTYRDNKVFVESWLVNKDTGELGVHQEEQRGKLYVLDDEDRSEPGFVDLESWETRPEVMEIPDGADGVGGRTLLRSFALERTNYRGGNLPEEIRYITPEDLGLVEENSMDSLPVMVRSDKVKVRSAKGKSNGSSLYVELLLENKTDQQLTVKVPKGYLFEVIDPKAAVQNLVTDQDQKITIGRKSTRKMNISALCANHHFSTPNDHSMRPTIYRMKEPKKTQNEVWRDLDSRGY